MIKPPKISKDPEIRKKYQPEIKMILKSKIIGILSIILALSLIIISFFDVFNLSILLFVPLLGSLVYHENKQFNLYHDCLILKRFLYDKEYAKWFNEHHRNKSKDS